MKQPHHAAIFARSAIYDPREIKKQVEICMNFANSTGWIVDEKNIYIINGVKGQTNLFIKKIRECDVQ